MPVVYKATNRINGKCYVGVTSRTLPYRRAKHLVNVANGGRECPRFYDAIRKYGAKAFKWEVLATFELLALAYHHEFVVVRDLKPEYNVIEGGMYRPLSSSGMNRRATLCLEDGIVHPSATAAAKYYKAGVPEIAYAAKGEISNAAGGLHFVYRDTTMPKSERVAMIKAIDEAQIAARRRVVKRADRGWSAVQNGKDKLGRNAGGPLANAKSVICLDDGRVFDSISGASDHYDVDKSAVSELCRGKRFRQTVGGKHFSFIQDVGQRWMA
jgi:group I intron endonuclease